MTVNEEVKQIVHRASYMKMRTMAIAHRAQYRRDLKAAEYWETKGDIERAATHRHFAAIQLRDAGEFDRLALSYDNRACGVLK